MRPVIQCAACLRAIDSLWSRSPDPFTQARTQLSVGEILERDQERPSGVLPRISFWPLLKVDTESSWGCRSGAGFIPITKMGYGSFRSRVFESMVDRCIFEYAPPWLSPLGTSFTVPRKQFRDLACAWHKHLCLLPASRRIWAQPRQHKPRFRNSRNRSKPIQNVSWPLTCPARVMRNELFMYSAIRGGSMHFSRPSRPDYAD